ncbi:MAG: helix-turn-helix domain-containing protein [Lachnobacterium sp.]|nr:helix-turn-helix domain-containing protein [Lachnobacterium sp.]
MIGEVWLTEKIPLWEKANLTIEEAAEYSNIGQNRISEMLRMPRCPFVLYVGKKKLVKRKEFEKFLADSIEL